VQNKPADLLLIAVAFLLVFVALFLLAGREAFRPVVILYLLVSEKVEKGNSNSRVDNGLPRKQRYDLDLPGVLYCQT
jgi:hypothetical protein